MGPAGDEDHEGPPDDRDDDRGPGRELGRDDDPMGAEDDRPRGAPPDRMDRIWVHPTELSPVRSPSRSRARLGRFVTPLAAGALGAIVAIGVLGLLGAFDNGGDGAASVPPEEQFGPNDAAVSQLADIVAPGLVLVTAKDANGTRQASGVCVRHSGEILTSTAVIGDATAVQVTTSDGDLVDATVLGRDDVTGLVLLNAERPMRAVPLSEVSGSPGDSVWIFGAVPPHETSPWISSGILSSTDAVVAASPGPMTRGLLETDALGTAWASGGALVDRTGAVSGIVLAPTLTSRSAYAVPIETAIATANELRDHGSVAHGTMPFDGTDTPAGPTVTAMAPDGAAARAGIVPGDVLVSINGREVLDLAEVTAMVHGFDPGSTVEIELLRAGAPMKVDVTLGSTRPGPVGG